VLEASVLARIPTELTVSIERETFPRMLEERGRLYAVGTDDYWIDIGTPTKYLEAHRDLLAGRLGPAPAPGAHELRPGVWVDGDVALAPDATVVAPCLLGRGAAVGTGARVVGSTLGHGCTVGAGAVVEGSVVCDGASLADGVRVVGSIVGVDAVLDAGATVCDTSVVGASAHLPAGTTLAGARIPG
jgi:NDP-sugar pyrophosphorylase family protein